MKRLYVISLILAGVILFGCNTTPPSKTLHQAESKSIIKLNSPIAIQVYPKGTKLSHPYTVIAKKSVSKYNTAGIKRQEATIHDALRNLAASVGGDAVINVTRENSKVTGTIVSFENRKIG